MKNNYLSKLCEYCKCTDYGLHLINTGYWNMCEGAYQDYKEDNPDDDRTVEEMF